MAARGEEGDASAAARAAAAASVNSIAPPPPRYAIETTAEKRTSFIDDRSVPPRIKGGSHAGKIMRVRVVGGVGRGRPGFDSRRRTEGRAERSELAEELLGEGEGGGVSVRVRVRPRARLRG